MKGDAKRAERFNLLATKVTQREKAAQLWVMEAAVARNDVKGALARYDIFLKTDTNVREQLFPQLAIALTDAEIRDPFVPYIRKAPNWLVPFLSFAGGWSLAPEALSSEAIRVQFLAVSHIACAASPACLNSSLA